MDNSMDILSLLTGIGSDPAAMGAIAELLKAFEKGNGGQARQENNGAETVRFANSPQFTASSSQIPSSAGPMNATSPSRGNGGPSGVSPELLGQLLSAFGGSSGRGGERQEGALRDGCGCDDGHVSVSKLLGGKEESENRIRLLNALRPYLSEERRCKLDLILKLLKVAEIGKLSGLLNSV